MHATSAVKLKAYTAVVRPSLEYASVIWDPHQQYQINQLERIQRLAVRFIFSEYRKTQSVTTLLARANLSTLSTRRKIARLKFLYQLSTNKFNLDQSRYLSRPSRVSPRVNHQYVFTPYNARIDVFKYSPLVRTIEDWNALDAQIFDDSMTVQSFEQKLEMYLS